VDSLDISYSEFKNAIHSSLAERLRERLAREKQIISNTILGDSEEDTTPETQSNADDN
jgi:exonuclease VII small subunit